jgi:YHS domain-containing protein
MRKWVPGRPEIATLYDEHVYRFPNEELKRKFDADPAKFTPALHGDSIVSLVKTGKRVPGDVNFSLIHDGRVFLVLNEKERQMFRQDPKAFADADLADGGKCAVCRVDSNEEVPGKPEYMVHYKGLRYLFPGPEQRATFLANPEKYAVTRGDGPQGSP